MISSRMQKRLVKMAEKLVMKKYDLYDCRGIACKWLKLTESWGVKFTYDGFEYMREVFKNQRRGWRIGIGPFCFGMFKVMLKNGGIYYGYITQIATLAHEVLEKKFGRMWFLETDNIFGTKIKRLMRIIRDKMHLTANDLHEDNWGFVNHQMVVTDWGFDAG